MSERIGVLFVCLGNICRSPVAEAVFLAQVRAAGLADRFDIDSAGTSDYHVGDPPDARTVNVAARRGVTLSHAARQISTDDFSRFDYIIAMDAANLGRIQHVSERSGARSEVRLLRSFDAMAGDDLEVPDPYFGGVSGFEDVHDIVERACAGLLEHIRREQAV